MIWHARLSTRLPFLAPVIRRAAEIWSKLDQGLIGRSLRVVIEKLRTLGLVSSQSRFVLTVGDEGATLVSFQRNQVVDALFVELDSDDGLETLRSFLIEDPQAELLVAADVLEQMYREEQLPRVSRWDRLSIVKRRLDVAFPHDRLRAAVPLLRGKDGAATVLFTALPVTSSIERWIEFLEALPNPVVGFCLLPLESELLGSRLSPPDVADSRRLWHALVSQQATSGFRQIFESEGHLVVTRLTQRPPGDMTAEAVAQLIERELRSSISYIKRLGYSDEDHLALVVLANADICDAVKQRDLPVTSLTALTPAAAGRNLGFGTVGPDDAPYSDVLHAVNLASKRRPRTFLPTTKMSERLKIESVFKASFAAAAAISLFAVLYIGSIAFNSYDTLTTGETLAHSVQAETLVLDSLRQKTRNYEIPLEQLVFVEQEDESLRKTQVNPTDFLRTVGSVLEPSTKVQKIVFSTPPKIVSSGKKEVEYAYVLELTVRFFDDSEDQATLHARQFRDRLVKAFPGHEVTIVQLPFSAFRARALEGSAGSTPLTKTATGPAIADYLIRKRA